jgi:hypothetical protein
MLTNFRNNLHAWADLIKIGLGIIAVVGFLLSANRWTINQDNSNATQDARLCKIETADQKRDTLLDKISYNQTILSVGLNIMMDRWDALEPEHLALLKQHGIFPQKMYRGDIQKLFKDSIRR